MYSLRPVQQLSELPAYVERAEMLNYLELTHDPAVWETKVYPLVLSAMQTIEDRIGQAVFSRTWELITDSLNHGCELPGLYVTEVASVHADGDLVDSDLFDFEADYLFLTNSFPAADRYKVTFTRGFHPGACPDSIRQAIKILVSEWYDNRTEGPRNLPTVVDKLLQPFRAIHVG